MTTLDCAPEGTPISHDAPARWRIWVERKDSLVYELLDTDDVGAVELDGVEPSCV